MGAAASMKHIYQDSLDWFKLYFDRLSYREDFAQLNVNQSGEITYEMLQAWIRKKAKDGTFWSHLAGSDAILRISFDLVAKDSTGENPAMVVGLASFKEFLVHLFVLSILWVHFRHADEWTEETVDLANEKLTFAQFKMACRTFTAANAHEQVTDEKLQEDFDSLDLDKSGTIEFSEICRYCANFFDADFAKKFATQETAAMARKVHTYDGEVHPDEKSLKYIRTVRMSAELTTTPPTTLSGVMVVHAGAQEGGGSGGGGGEKPMLFTASAKAHKAMDFIGERMEENNKAAAFEEIKVQTEQLLGL